MLGKIIFSHLSISSTLYANDCLTENQWTILDLDGEKYFFATNYWVKIEARKVSPTEHIPHGRKYSLTLHDQYYERIIGYERPLHGQITGGLGS